MAETVGLPWRAEPGKPISKHLPRAEARRTLPTPEIVLAFRLLLSAANLRSIAAGVLSVSADGAKRMVRPELGLMSR